ncbi:Uncharacterized protein dnm_024110 [Desulfonema magnum]|uniref:Uncharacterized protein n=1 Tax=Desulfonema magnum TaxID=45655 RepID=A0A975BJB0_9BACT|nr:Uncharacterized protein dnm_024110 [Desulfonema magnum]
MFHYYFFIIKEIIKVASAFATRISYKKRILSPFCHPLLI